MFRSRSAPGRSSSQHSPVSAAAPLTPQPPQKPQPLVDTNNNTIECSVSPARKTPRDAIFNRETNSVASSSFVPASQYHQSKWINRADTTNVMLEFDWTREYNSDTDYSYHEVIEEVAEEFFLQTPEPEDHDESDEDTMEAVVLDSFGDVVLTKLRLWNPITRHISVPTPCSCLSCGQALDWITSGMLRPGYKTTKATVLVVA
ncbi:hypothetical protein BC830DRAFT_1079474 [Chytriomyces sp. MP71]|nr:hypothetical protein BC830DRAFT_1079474 [Chytriomyces sp. MP71]